jgi:hypothetical protein
MYGMSNSHMMVFIQEDSILHPFWIYLPFDLNTFHNMPLLWLLRNPLLNTPTYLPLLITCHFVAFKKFILNILTCYLIFQITCHFCGFSEIHFQIHPHAIWCYASHNLALLWFLRNPILISSIWSYASHNQALLWLLMKSTFESTYHLILCFQ